VDIHFIGVGEACDSAHGNTSALVVTNNGSRVLLDCGFSVPHYFFHDFADDPDLDYIWISHFHGDHFLGLPLLFLRLWQANRTRPLPIVSQKGVAEKVKQSLELAFPGFEKKLSFDLEFHVVEADKTTTIGGLSWSTARTRHSQYNLGLLLDDGSKRLYFSGDGRPTEQVKELVQECDCIIHESFTFVDEFPYHGSITSSIELAESVGTETLALTHLDRDFRKNEINRINTVVQARPGTLLPVAGDHLVI
jgi:ribonuclease BN (tRNA processing enzyme)